ncbi:MAG TPA: hypothetical protein VN703_06610 [Candidatus Sulfopaludibacter sp.]|nr:hypothetical protein [Candidatus Sulfopaludibacter sp.]
MTESLRQKFEEIEKHIGDNEDNSFNDSSEEGEQNEEDMSIKEIDYMTKKDLLRYLSNISDMVKYDLEDYKTYIDKMKSYKTKLLYKQKLIEKNCNTLGKIRQTLEDKYDHKIE